MTTTVYRRPLPADLVAFSSVEGKRLFREALDEGGMEGWFRLAEQFHTQTEPAFCGLGSLVVALNALGVDPQRLWKGPWRWFSEELLDCCVSLDEVRARGLTLTEVGCLARCNGVTATVSHASEMTADDLRNDVADAARGTESIVIASYARGPLGQTGSGHFSPLAGFHRREDATLLLDVARFKYPPHWVPITRLHHAMLDHDHESGRSRGWLVLRRHAGAEAGGILLSLACRAIAWERVVTVLDAPLERWRTNPPASLDEALAVVIEALPSLEPHVAWRDPVDDLHAKSVERLRSELAASAVGRRVGAGAGAGAGERSALAAAYLYALAPEDFEVLGASIAESARALASLEPLTPELRAEILRVREQLTALRRQAIIPVGAPRA